MIAAALGWVGTIGTISAYVLLSRGHWHATSLRYAALNAVAGFLGAAGSTMYGAWPSVASNLLWSCIAVHSMLLTHGERRAARLATVVELNRESDLPSGELPALARAA